MPPTPMPTAMATVLVVELDVVPAPTPIAPNVPMRTANTAATLKKAAMTRGPDGWRSRRSVSSSMVEPVRTREAYAAPAADPAVGTTAPPKAGRRRRGPGPRCPRSRSRQCRRRSDTYPPAPTVANGWRGSTLTPQVARSAQCFLPARGQSELQADGKQPLSLERDCSEPGARVARGDNLFAKGSDGDSGQLEVSDPQGNPDDGEAPEHSHDQVSDSHP